jgi:hypothetical protein
VTATYSFRQTRPYGRHVKTNPRFGVRKFNWI